MITEVIVLTERGRYHRGAMLGDNLATAEGCNLDDSAGYEVVDSIPEDTELEAYCERCFPRSDEG